MIEWLEPTRAIRCESINKNMRKNAAAEYSKPSKIGDRLVPVNLSKNISKNWRKNQSK